MNGPVFRSDAVRSVVVIGQKPYLPSRWSVNKNGHGATDDCTVTLPVKGNPDFSKLLYQSGNTAFKPVPIAIMAGFPTNPVPLSFDTSSMSTRFLGNLDLYNASIDGDEVTFTGRSLAAPLIDQKLTSAPMNMTAPQFAAALAAQLGLTLNVLLEDNNQQPVTIQEMLGREFVGGPQLNSIVYNMHPWDVLLQCALFDDVDVWVDGQQLNYQSPSKIQRTTVPLEYLQFIIEPKLSHSVQFNKNIRVEVRTYQRHERRATTVRADGDAATGITITVNSKVITSTPIFGTSNTVSTTTTPTGTSTTTSTGSGGAFNASTGSESESSKQIYKIYRKNLSQANATKLAQSLWRQYSAQEYAIEFSVMMTPTLLQTLSITSLFKISNLPYAEFNRAGTVADGYYPRKLVESYDPESSGWDVAVTAINLVSPSGAV